MTNHKKNDIEALAEKAAIIIAQLVEIYPPENGKPNISRQGWEYLNDDENDVSFIANTSKSQHECFWIFSF